MRRPVCTSLVILGALPCGCSRGSPAARAAVVALVNGEAITALAFQKDLAQSRRGSEGLGPRSEEELRASRQAELQRLVERTELLQVARQDGISATDGEVEKAALAMRADYPGTSFDELLADEEIAPADLRSRLRDQLTIRKLFTQSVFSRIAVTETEIETYYAAHAKDLQRPEQVHAAQIVVKTEEEAQALRTAIKAGAVSFSDAARRHSLSPDARKGGDLGWFSRGMMPTIFEEICFTLPVGTLSDVVPSSYGFHLFRVLEHRPAGPRTLEEAKPQIEAMLRREKNTKAEAVFLAEIKGKAQVTVDETTAARVR